MQSAQKKKTTVKNAPKEAPKTTKTTKTTVKKTESKVEATPKAPPKSEVVTKKGKNVEKVENVESEVAVVNGNKVVDRDSVIESFDSLSNMIELEIQSMRENSQKTKGIKFLRSLNKNLKNLKTQCGKVMKKKNSTVRKNNNNSGFLKPVAISKEMASFTGWSPTEPKSRVEVTKFICDYITENNLQNPEDRRQIRPDDKLKKLLVLKGDEDLRYYSLQTHLKKHFPKMD